MENPANGLFVEPTDQRALSDRIAFLNDHNDDQKRIFVEVQNGLTILRNVHLKA